ncbi:M48 family metallopeptidase [Candidatus Roizmanbacteria bacterium]|nr:M48 family metallopeptidase [Candidatus Roizmanbacteria bacterium]
MHATSEIIIDGKAIPYKVEKTRSRKWSVGFKVTPEGIVVRAPMLVPDIAIRLILKNKQNWIVKQLNKIHKQESPAAHKYINGEVFSFFGNPYILEIRESLDYLRPIVMLETDHLVVCLPLIVQENKNKKIKELIKNWYLKEGKRIMNEKSEYFATILGMKFNALHLKEVSSIWGSCSRDQNLSFSWKLTLAPKNVSDYVVIHEVCHLVHKHHGKQFWECVKKFEPNYKERIKWLKENSHTLVL